MGNWVLKMVKARCRRRTIAWGLVVACAMWMGFAQRRYLGNFLMGPFEVGATELDSITDVAQTPASKSLLSLLRE